jgi:hypothetical protein
MTKTQLKNAKDNEKMAAKQQKDKNAHKEG